MRHSLSELHWTLTGFTPYAWSWASLGEAASDPRADVPAVPAPVPGSVQAALRAANLVPDWFTGLDSRACEWVEHRHWVYRTEIPADWFGAHNRLVCLGLDYRGLVRLGGAEIGTFEGTFVPHVFPVASPAGDTTLELVFLEPPRWLGQLGYTSRMTDWKARFNYGWDWTSRVVQTGIFDEVLLETAETSAFDGFSCRSEIVRGAEVARQPSVDADGTPAGRVSARWDVWGDRPRDGHVVIELLDPDGSTRATTTAPADSGSATIDVDSVALWWPNGYGGRPLYRVRAQLRNADGTVVDSEERRVGFRQIDWRRCDGSPAAARPWICVVNGRPIFLQGVNWTPIRPTFADVSRDELHARLATYREMGCTVLRVWGGATLESHAFYQACDEMGLLVWQEFPLSSSGLDNWPPEDPAAVDQMAAIVESYAVRRCHHASLLLWCGGNELQGGPDGEKAGVGRPIDETHPMIARMADVVATHDPGRRFLPTSSSGPRFDADSAEFGHGLHHDVHGPWSLPGGTLESARRYWEQDDALFRSEVGAPGASAEDVIEEYSGGLPTMPASAENPLWRRSSWWIEWDEFLASRGSDAGDPTLSEFVAWSASRQAEALKLAATAVKRRFPRAGGFIVWMGHDSFPCTANTAVLDFYGRMKPAAHALAEVFHTPSEDL